jgi:hypothetical protein
MDGTCSTHGREENTHRSLVGNPGGKRVILKCTSNRMAICGLDASGCSWGLMKMVMKLLVPQDAC